MSRACGYHVVVCVRVAEHGPPVPRGCLRTVCHATDVLRLLALEPLEEFGDGGAVAPCIGRRLLVGANDAKMFRQRCLQRPLLLHQLFQIVPQIGHIQQRFLADGDLRRQLLVPSDIRMRTRRTHQTGKRQIEG